MLRKTIKFEDLDGNEIVDEFYFHYTKMELAKLEATLPGGLSGSFQAAMDAAKKNDGAKAIAFIEMFVKNAYGRRSDDNRSFVKTERQIEEFVNSDAFEQLVWELCMNPEKLVEFVNGAISKELQKMLASEMKKRNIDEFTPAMLDKLSAEILEDKQPALVVNPPLMKSLTPEDFTENELVNLTSQDLTLLMEGELLEKPNYLKAGRTLDQYNRHELLTMPDDQFDELVGKDQKKWSKTVLAIAMMRQTRKQ